MFWSSVERELNEGIDMNPKLPLIFLKNTGLLFLLLLISKIGFAQVKQINIKILDSGTDLLIEGYSKDYCIFQLGDRVPQQIAPNYAATFQYFLFEGDAELVDLEDTLYISHLDYIFEELPISHQDYKIEDEIIWLTIYAKPWYNFYYELDIPVDKRAKVKNDSILLRAMHPEYLQNASIDYYPKFEKSKEPTKYTLPRTTSDWEMYTGKIPYDAVKDGFFIAEFTTQTDTIAFQAENWYQIQILQETSIEFYPPKPREKELIKAYLESVKTQANLMEEMEDEYLAEIKDLEKIIQNLNQVIDSLTGRVLPVPELELEPEEEEIVHVVVTENARPEQGFATLLETLKTRLQELNVENAGNITLELEIKKDGHLKLFPLHLMQNSEDTFNTIQYFLKEQEWRPARIRGKPVEQKIILSLNFIAKE